jgi:aconitase A
VKKPPYFEGMPAEPKAPAPIVGARVLAVLGDSVTTDHISPAGSIAKTSPAAAYLVKNGVDPADFNSYGARRGNHEVMARGTFANVRLRNALVPGIEGGVTRYLPEGIQMSIFDAAERYRADGTPLIVIAGKEYGSGSSRDWAAKGPMLLGIRAVIAESFERIHRSNLIGMGILPLEFVPGQSRASLALTGEEAYEIAGLPERIVPRSRVTVHARAAKLSTPICTTLRLRAKLTQHVLQDPAVPIVLRLVRRIDAHDRFERLRDTGPVRRACVHGDATARNDALRQARDLVRFFAGERERRARLTGNELERQDAHAD